MPSLGYCGGTCSNKHSSAASHSTAGQGTPLRRHWRKIVRNAYNWLGGLTRILGHTRNIEMPGTHFSTTDSVENLHHLTLQTTVSLVIFRPLLIRRLRFGRMLP